jgi:PAS domain S-box-containing protein
VPENWSRIIVEAAPNAMVMVNAERTIMVVNHGAEVLFGYSRDELIGRPIEVLIPEPSRERHPSLVAGFLGAPKARPMGAGRELFALRKDGARVPVEIGLTPIKTPDALYTLASIIDITARKREEEQFRLVVEAAPYAMLIVGNDRTITLVNRKTEELFGYAREELIGQPIEILVPESMRAAHADRVRGFLAAPTARPIDSRRELTALTRDGREVPVEIGLNPFRGPDGPLTLASIVDITERKRREDELKRSNEELEQFAYVASHDLQEPLRMVASYTQLLEQRYKGKLDEKADKYIFYAVDGAKRMQRLITDLLVYSRVGSQGKPLVPVPAGDAVRRVTETLTEQIRSARATVETGELPVVLADEGQLCQLFQNLIGNAIKFRGESAPVVRVTATPQDHHWVFAVRDNGIGFDMQYADRAFQMFQRLHERGRYEGSGIGLAIAKRIVERHGGRIWLESQPGAGTTFFFSLLSPPSDESS